MIAVVAEANVGAVTAALTREGEIVIRLGGIVAADGGARVRYSGHMDLAG